MGKDREVSEVDCIMLSTWTIPRVADVTGSEKSPPGGETLKKKNNSH